MTIEQRNRHSNHCRLSLRESSDTFAERKATMISRTVICCLLAFSASLPSSVDAGTSNSLMDISADGKLLACSNRDGGTVTIVDLASHTKLREVAVGTKPEGVTFLGDSHRLAVNESGAAGPWSSTARIPGSPAP